ncbi:DUF1837 domain-containing protein [Clostridia bacterium]|nr:DUF1837 domain-containing protein [Clostridia bacterium]
MSLFISYNREQKDFADKIESSVRTVCTVLRDTNDIAPWASIEEFMNRIRQAKYAVLLISDEYLKSINCMYEACQLYKDVNWKSRTMYVVLGNADLNIYTVANHERYIRFWKDKKTILEEQIKNLPAESIDSITAEIKRVSEILLMLGDLLKIIRDTNNMQPENTIDEIISFITTKSVPKEANLGEHSRATSSVLDKTLVDAGFDGVFSEVLHSEKLGLINPYQLRLFQLSVVDNAFSFDALKKFLLKNIGQYIYSRERIKKYIDDEEIMLIGLKAVELMKERSNGDCSWLGDELGDLMLYVFLEGILKAPKVFSKFDAPSDGVLTTGTSGVHLLKPDAEVPSFQMVFGKSSIVGDPKDSIDNAFVTLEAIKNDRSREMRLVESTAFDKEFTPEVAEYLKNIILPSKEKRVSHDTAFGVFLGYSLGLDADKYTSAEFAINLESKMKLDIKSHVSYIVDKIKAAKMERYSFYFYFLPLNDADGEKQSIMQSILRGGV